MVRTAPPLRVHGRLTYTPCRYISAGKGHGNIYGLAAVTAVCFPFFFFGRLYWPGAPMFNLIVRAPCSADGTR